MVAVRGPGSRPQGSHLPRGGRVPRLQHDGAWHPIPRPCTHTNTHTHRNRHFFLTSLSICPSLLLTLTRSPHPRSDTHLHRRQEDFEFVCRIRARALASGGRVRILRQTARCSSRRWDKKGVYKNTFLNWGFVFLYWVGVGPDTIFRLYYGR